MLKYLGNLISRILAIGILANLMKEIPFFLSKNNSKRLNCWVYMVACSNFLIYFGCIGISTVLFMASYGLIDYQANSQLDSNIQDAYKI
jgi:hypothetical protein